MNIVVMIIPDTAKTMDWTKQYRRFSIILRSYYKENSKQMHVTMSTVNKNNF